MRVMQHEPGSERFMLVHGVVREKVGHAWVELDDGTIYDPVFDLRMAAVEYATSERAIEERRYTRAQALEKTLEYKNYGPWHDTRGKFINKKGRGV